MGRPWSKQRCDVWKRRIRRIAKAGPGTMLKWVGAEHVWGDVVAVMNPMSDTTYLRSPTVQLSGMLVKEVEPGETMTLMGPVEAYGEPRYPDMERHTRASAPVLLSDGRVGVFDDIGGCMVLWDPNASTRKKRKK